MHAICLEVMATGNQVQSAVRNGGTSVGHLAPVLLVPRHIKRFHVTSDSIELTWTADGDTPCELLASHVSVGSLLTVVDVTTNRTVALL